MLVTDISIPVSKFCYIELFSLHCSLSIEALIIQSSPTSNIPAPTVKKGSMQTQASSSRLPPSGKSNRASKLRSSRQIMTAPPTPDNGYRTNRSFGGPSSSRNQKETEKSQGKGIGKANRDVLRSVRPLPGGLDVEKFVMARSFEIQALKSAMKTAA